MVIDSSIATHIDDIKMVKCEVSDVLTVLRGNVNHVIDPAPIDKPFNTGCMPPEWSTIVNGRATSCTAPS